MRFLLDEGLPVQLLGPLRLNHGCSFDHVDELGWKGKQDPFLIRDAANRDYQALIALDVNQLADPDECRDLKQSGLHHISLRQGSRIQGRKGVARIIASIVVAMPYVIEDLRSKTRQHVVEISLFAGSARHELLDPRREHERLPYWPR